ncbi:MAG: hemolysin family protein [Lentisphaeria bacterium]|nr:hemolysin family protein [Lentisphaeria bacterium]
MVLIPATITLPDTGPGFSWFLLRSVLLCVLLALSAFFSSSETALFSLSRSQTARLKHGSRGGRLAAVLLTDPRRLLSTIIIGNMFVNVFLASLIASGARDLLSEGGVLPAIFVSTAFLLLFGEVTPKTLAVGKAEWLSCHVSYPLSLMAVLFTPLRVLLRSAANLVLFLMGQSAVKKWSGVTREEVAAVVSLGEAQGVATAQERELLHNILDVTTVDTRSIMVPRTDITGVEDRLTVAEALAVARSHRRSRLPVYHEDLDDSWGIFSAVDVLRACDDAVMNTPLVGFRDRVKASKSPLDDVPVYPALLSPESARVDQLLDEMRQRRASAALIVDEYGGTSGMLTIDDILAQIVGNVGADKGETDGVIECGGTLLLEGSTSLRVFQKRARIHFPETNADTLTGLVMERLGRIPRAGDKVAGDGWELEVIRMAGRRVGTLRFNRLAVKRDEESR